MRTWFRVHAAASNEVEILIYGDIGRSLWDEEAVESKEFVRELQMLPPTVTALRVRVNSLGGDMFEAVAIANALREQHTSKGRAVTVVIDSVAASAASIVIMAGQRIQIAQNALIMIHDPFVFTIGNAGELRKMADDLDTIKTTIVSTYKWHSPLSDSEIMALMDAETWFDADAAIANGFATERVAAPDGDAAERVVAMVNPRVLARLASAPEPWHTRVAALMTRPTPPAPPPAGAATASEVLRACREASCLTLAEELVAAGATLEAVQARVRDEQQRRHQAETRATQIRALCQSAKLPELAAGYIQGAMPFDAIRAQLTVLTAKLDGVEIDGSLLPPGSGPAAGRHFPSTAQIYRARNAADEGGQHS